MSVLQPPLPRDLGAVNWLGLRTLYLKEVRRFLKVYQQTVTGPVLTTLLFYLVFTLALGGAGRGVAGIPYLAFLAPGLVMMAVMQNAFSNTASSIVTAKIQGNIVDVLMPPVSPPELAAGYLLAGVTRGVVVGTACGIVLFTIAGLWPHNPLVLVFYLLSAALMLTTLGLIVGLWAEKYDNQQTITNFIITPASFLSGTFYSVDRLPGLWGVVAHLNPFFYLIDGFRYGAIGFADSPLWVGACLVTGLNMALIGLVHYLLRTGWRLKA